MIAHRRPAPTTTPLVLRLAGLATLALFGITCRDRDPMGPGLPSQASLAVAPQMQRAALAGGPSFLAMRSVHGLLTPIGGGASYAVDADFVGDTATLEFNITFAGPTQRYSLALAATDTAGDTLFRSMREVLANPGSNEPVSEVMTYVAPDTGVRTIFLVPADSIILAGDTIAITATGIDARQAAVSPLYVGWTSRDTNVARVIATGPSSGRVAAKSLESAVWIVARAFNGTADSVSVRVALRVGSVALSADTIHLAQGTLATAQATVLDASGAVIDRPVTFVSLDTAILKVSALLGAAPQVAVAPQVTQLIGARAGTTKLVASSGGKADTAVVIVDPPGVAVVHIIPDSIALNPRDSARFGVVLLSAAGDTLNGRAVTWATGSALISTVSASGTVLAVATGRTFVTAASEGVVDTAWVNVLTTGTSIVRTVVSPKTLHLVALGDRAQLVAQGYAGDSSLVPGRYTWTVRQALPLLSVDSLGGVTALAVGSAWVVATEKGGTADSAQVTIDQLVQTVQITPAQASGAVGDTIHFTASAIDARGNPIAYGTAVWSNLERFVTSIDATGATALVEPGLDTVSVTINGLTAHAEVNVYGPASAVTISGRSMFTALRDTAILHAAVLDRAQQAIKGATIDWVSDNPAVVAVSSVAGDSAIIVAQSNGSAQVTARVGTASGATPVAVSQQGKGAVLSPASASLSLGGRAIFTPMLVDATGVAIPLDAGEKVVWSLSSAADSAIAQVDGSGEVLARGGQGTATVSAIVRGIAATAAVSISDTAQRRVSFGRDTILVGLDTVQVPVILSAPAGGAGLTVTLGTDSSSAAHWVGDTVRFGATETLQYAKLTGGEAGSTALTASDSSRLYGQAAATGVVRASARFADFWLNPVDTLRVNASDDIPLRVMMRDPAPNGGASLDVLAEGPQGIAAIAPAPFTIPGGQLVADVVLHAAAPGTMRYTPLTRGLPGVGSTVVIDSALFTLQVDTSNNGCDGPCEVKARTSPSGLHVSPTTPYNAPRRTTASRAVLAQQRTAVQALPAPTSAPRTTTQVGGQLYLPSPGDPNNIILGAGQYLPTSGARGDCYYRCGAVLSLPKRSFAGVHATLAVDDPSVARAEPEVVIPLDYARTYLNVSGLATGTTVLRARSADWREAALSVTVTTPRLIAITNGEQSTVGNVHTLQGGIEGDSVDVLVADSLMIAHPRLSSLAVHASSSDPSVVDVRDSLAVIAPGEAHTAVFLIARGEGTAWIRVRSGGHVSDSAAVRVEAARIRTDTQVVYIGAGQLRSAIPVELPKAATHTVSVAVRSLDTRVIAVQDTSFTIAPGWTYPRTGPSGATLVGTAPGAGRVVVEADSGFAPDTVSVVVTSPYVGVYAPNGTVGVAGAIYVISEDSVGNWNASANAAGLDSIHVVSADSAIIALDTVVAIPAGAQYVAFNVTPRRPGTVTLTASRTGYRSAAPIPTIVGGSLLSAGIACDVYYSCPSSVTGVGLRSGPQDARVSVSTPATRDVVVRFAGAKHVQLPDSVVIPIGSTEVRFGWNGVAIGTDSITVTADSGYNPTVLALGAGATTISAELNGNYNWAPDSALAGSSLPLVIRLYDPTFTQRQPVDPVAFRITSTDSKIISPDSATVHLSVDLTQTQAIQVHYVQSGKATLTVSDSAGLFTPMTLGPTVVHAPALRFTSSSYSVGMRQTVDVNVTLPSGAIGTEVRLRSSDERIAKAIADRDTTNTYPYDQASFTVEAYDTTGTIQLTATTSNGIDKGTIALTVTHGVLGMYVPSDPSLLDQDTPDVSLLDEFGWQHPTTVPVAVTITSSHPDVVGPSPITFTIPSGASGASPDQSLSFLRTGMATLSARDAQGGYRAYRPVVDTVIVRQAQLYSYDGELRLAPGQRYQVDAGLAQLSRGTENAHFEVRPGKSIAPIPDQVIGGGSWDLYYDVVATAPGIDTVIVQVDGYAPARTLVRVGQGTISFDDQGGMPDSLAAGDSVAVALTAFGPQGNSNPQADSATFAIAYGGSGIVATDGTLTLSSVQVPAGATTSPVFWIKATGPVGSIGDVLFSRAGYGSYRARLRVVAMAPPVGVAVMPRTLP